MKGKRLEQGGRPKNKKKISDVVVWGGGVGGGGPAFFFVLGFWVLAFGHWRFVQRFLDVQAKAAWMDGRSGFCLRVHTFLFLVRLF